MNSAQKNSKTSQQCFYVNRIIKSYSVKFFILSEFNRQVKKKTVPDYMEKCGLNSNLQNVYYTYQCIVLNLVSTGY